MTRLFLWRKNSQEPWLTYGYNRVTFGNQIAPLALELAKSQAADLEQDIHPSTTDKIKNKLYVDDGAIAADSRDELERMRGERIPDGTYTGYVFKILEKCGMAPKFIQICWDSGEEEKQLGGAVLGVDYDCPDDMIRFSFPATFQKKGYRGGPKIKEEISKKDLQMIRAGQGTLCLRTVLSYIMGQ